MENPIQQLEAWAWQVAAKKIVVGIVKAAVGILLGIKAQGIATQLGIQADPIKLEAGLTVFAWAGLEALHDWAKLKFPDVVKF